jgi:hypothetical protein
VSAGAEVERILVYAVTGSGKSTLAERISAALHLPCHLVDELTWEPGWAMVDEGEQRRRIGAICAVLPRLDHRLALPVLRTQAGPDALPGSGADCRCAASAAGATPNRWLASLG